MKAILPLEITSMTLVSGLGHGLEAHVNALLEQRSGLKPGGFEGSDLSTYIGEVDAVNDVTIEGEHSRLNCRNNRLAHLCLQQDDFVSSVEALKQKYGPRRIGLFLGTSTSGVQQTEMAFAQMMVEQGEQLPDWFDYDSTQSTFSAAEYTRLLLGLDGVFQVIATACSSSAKVFATAWRYINAGYCDAAIVGGVDSLCLMTLYGFNSLGLVSEQPCKPYDADRNGISIGEAAGFAILQRPGEASSGNNVSLLGFGETSDGYHMSSPHPEGLGAAMAMQQAIDRAGLDPAVIDYINLHGTATPANDRSEDCAVSGMFGSTACSSTKGWTGHTLGAAGIVEAIFSAVCIKKNFVPGSLNTKNLDEQLSANVVMQTRQQEVSYVLSNSFGFGGNNCSLLFGEA